MSRALQNANGPATAPTVPSHGPIIPHKETKMNTHTNTTGPAVLPASKSKPTDKEIAAALDDLSGDVFNLRRAAMVLEEFATYEFRAGRGQDGGFSYGLTKEQVDGILYLAGHVRDLTTNLEIAFDKAFGREEGQ